MKYDIKLKKYLNQFNVNSISELTLNQANILFCNIIKEFKEYKISLDDLAYLGSFVFHEFAKHQKGETDLFRASLAASELNFATRSSAVYKNIVYFLKDVDKFFKKYSPQPKKNK